MKSCSKKKRKERRFNVFPQLPEIERTCDRAAIIKDGIIIAVKDIHELQSMQRKVFEVTFENTGDIPAFMNSGLQIESRTDNRVKVAVLGTMINLLKKPPNITFGTLMLLHKAWKRFS